MPNAEGAGGQREDVNVYRGVQDVFKPSSEVEVHAERIRRKGFTVVPSCFDSAKLDLFRARIDACYQHQIDSVGGEKVLFEIGDQFSAKGLCTFDDCFLEMIQHPMVLSLVRHFLGERFILHLQNGVINVPQIFNPAANWHRDLFFQNYTSSRPLSISALYAIDDFDAETGGTHFLEGSHLFEEFPSVGYVEENAKQLSVPAGSIMIFDSMMFHRAGHNRSNRMRRSVSNIFTAPMIRQQICLPDMLQGRHSQDPVIAGILGYGFEGSRSIESWRLERYKKRVGTGYSAVRSP